ncbi:MAG: hypothetical protein MI700_05890 [Balneolales bacterium]|nr:hypothetical protein [Balneolales bacterium]
MELYKDKAPYNEEYTLERFFGLDKHPIYPDRKYHTHQKVTVAYNILNTIGYYSDPKTHKEDKFNSFMSDSSHATMATFCDALFSADERLTRKAFAIYEYLKIGIRVEYVVL